MRLFLKILLLIWIASSMVSCTGTQSISGKNVSFLYSNREAGNLGIQYEVVHYAEHATVYWRLRQSLLEIGETQEGEANIGCVIRYRLYTSYSSPEPVDSGNIILKGMIPTASTWLSDSFDLAVLNDRNLIMDITIKDLNSLRSNRQLVDIHKPESFGINSYLLRNTQGDLLYEKFIPRPDTYKLISPTYSGDLYFKFYGRDFPFASPPFTTVAPKPFDFTPDRLEQLSREGGHYTVPILKKGFYQITNEPTKKSGGTIFYFGEFYPYSKVVMDLAMPIRYISTNEEYDGLMNGDNLKKNVDAYWLRIGGNPSRARELIKAYYTRVQEANQQFESYIEGWKTDRGMCYIVFGAPNVVQRGTSSETWLYGEEGKYNSLSLTFTKVSNPFTTNDFRLNRSGALKTPWHRAVDFWRQGRVLTYK